MGLPVAERNYSNLAVANNGDLFFLRKIQPGAASLPQGEPEQAENELMRFSFDDEEGRAGDVRGNCCGDQCRW